MNAKEKKNYLNQVMNLDPRKELEKKINNKIKRIFEDNRGVTSEIEVQKLIDEHKKVCLLVDKLLIYSFDTVEMRNHYRKEIGIL